MSALTRYRQLDGKRVKVVMREGHEGFVARWTDSCSGCTEFVDGHNVFKFAWDSKSKCHVGAGCDECGYTGKVRNEMWFPFDLIAWNEHVSNEEEIAV